MLCIMYSIISPIARTRTRTRIYYIKVTPSSGQVCNIHLTKRKTKYLDSRPLYFSVDMTLN